LMLVVLAQACAGTSIETTTTTAVTVTTARASIAPVDLETTELLSTELLVVGDCFDIALSGATEPASCDEPHGLETFAVLTFSQREGTPYPGDAATNDFAFEACLAEFDRFVGAGWLASGLDILAISPTGESWEIDDRGIVCGLLAISGDDLTGSLKESGALPHEGVRGPNEFQVGDCFDDPQGPGLGVVLEPCSALHDSEVYAVVDYSLESNVEFPGEDVLEAFALEFCLAEFERYVGKPFLDSSLDAFPLFPGGYTWLAGDRQVACVLFDANLRRLEGSMEGSGL
jgi:hypothetical protein